MKEHPILFSTPMVQAILEGRKTMTRRILKVKGCKPFVPQPEEWTLSDIEKWNKDYHPYGQVGDIIWVRESFKLAGWNFEQGLMTIEYKDGSMFICNAYDPSDDLIWLLDQVEALENGGYIEPSPTEKDAFILTEKRQPFKPSIHMPKEAARIWLKITNVNVERLQSISEVDAMKEGVDFEWYDQGRNIKIEAAKQLFKKLWYSIHGRESWEANPWVWAIEFEVLSTTGKPAGL